MRNKPFVQFVQGKQLRNAIDFNISLECDMITTKLYSLQFEYFHLLLAY